MPWALRARRSTWTPVVAPTCARRGSGEGKSIWRVISGKNRREKAPMRRRRRCWKIRLWSMRVPRRIDRYYVNDTPCGKIGQQPHEVRLPALLGGFARGLRRNRSTRCVFRVENGLGPESRHPGEASLPRPSRRSARPIAPRLENSTRRLWQSPADCLDPGVPALLL